MPVPTTASHHPVTESTSLFATKPVCRLLFCAAFPLLFPHVPCKSMINNCTQGGSLVAAILTVNAMQHWSHIPLHCHAPLTKLPSTPPPRCPPQVPFKSMINNCTQGGSLVAAILTGDAALLGAALDSDVIIEPVRGPLIPGMLDVKAAAKAAGASLHSLARVYKWRQRWLGLGFDILWLEDA